DAEPEAESDAESEVEAEAPIASASASVAPPPVASASASAKPEAPSNLPESPVRLHDKRVFTIRLAHGGINAEERARRASAALERAFDENETGDTHVDEAKADLAVVLVGNRPIVELTQEDAEAAGDASLSAHAAGVSENIRSALKAERTRRDVANKVLS